MVRRVAGPGHGDVGHGRPHGALVGVGAAEPAAEQEEAGEELLAHGRALGGEGVGHGRHSAWIYRCAKR